MTLHRIERESNNGTTLAILKCRSGYLKAWCCKVPPDDTKLVEVKIDPRDPREYRANYWYKAIFESSSDYISIEIRPLKWGASFDETVDGEFPQEESLMWLDLARVGLTNAFDPNALREGLLALERLEREKANYSLIMNQLGFKHNERGSYEDYKEWLALPGLPMVTFPVEE